mmetsp:Transcript_6008/g.19254  ORF Transcript_6008/g.19254 Transcript_6008/m.19254 type:complete len:203 (-) Transcript_6008:671-1279(-)
MQTALGGGASSPSGSGCGPRATTSSGPSSALSAPKASKAPPQADRQSSAPVSPHGRPSTPSRRAPQPKSGLSPVMTVPMLTSTTVRPDPRASFTRATGSGCPSADCRSPRSRSSAWYRCPAALRAPCASSSGPTASNLTPASRYSRASSGGMGSCMSSHVVTRTRLLSRSACSLPAGCMGPSMLSAAPYFALSRSMQSPRGL